MGYDAARKISSLPRSPCLIIRGRQRPSAPRSTAFSFGCDPRQAAEEGVPTPLCTDRNHSHDLDNPAIIRRHPTKRNQPGVAPTNLTVANADDPVIHPEICALQCSVEDRSSSMRSRKSQALNYRFAMRNPPTPDLDLTFRAMIATQRPAPDTMRHDSHRTCQQNIRPADSYVVR